MSLLLLSIICLLFCLLVYLLRFFDKRGTIATFLLLIVIIIAAPPWSFLVLVTGYIMILVVTVYRENDKIRIRGTNKERTYTNVIGKVAAPLIAAIAGDVGMFISSTSFAVADSFAHEIGILSRRNPVLVTTGKPVNPGTNGAVSPLGTFACFVASFFMGLMISLVSLSLLQLTACSILALTTGVIGTFIDSFLGATLENRGLLSGWQVNFFSSIIIGVMGSYMNSFLGLTL